jgi:hypothetical protein
LEQDRSLGSTAQVPNYDEIDVDRLGFNDEANNIHFAIENTTKNFYFNIAKTIHEERWWSFTITGRPKSSVGFPR